MTKSTLGDLQDDLDSHDFHDTMEYVAALTDSEEVITANVRQKPKVKSPEEHAPQISATRPSRKRKAQGHSTECPQKN